MYSSLRSYKPDRFYWEFVVSARKVAVVALSVFGAELGPQRQCQVALLLILVCIVLEISGRPFREKTAAHSVLQKLELTSLLVVWMTLWCGLMIYQSGPRSKFMNVVMKERNKKKRERHNKKKKAVGLKISSVPRK